MELRLHVVGCKTVTSSPRIVWADSASDASKLPETVGLLLTRASAPQSGALTN